MLGVWQQCNEIEKVGGCLILLCGKLPFALCSELIKGLQRHLQIALCLRIASEVLLLGRTSAIGQDEK
jgi:hypothetical protein